MIANGKLKFLFPIIEKKEERNYSPKIPSL